MSVSFAVSALAFAGTALALSATDWQSQSIYQVLTDRYALTNSSTTVPCDTGNNVYCGGTWQGITNNLDYIQDAGFTAIWISPITEQIDVLGAFHGYWQQDIYALNSHFGTADDLNNLASALHSRGMYLMVDIVCNHNAYDGDSSQVDYSIYNPFNDASYYHQPIEISSNDYADNDTVVQTGWLYTTANALPDLNTTDADVISGYQSWIQYLINTYDIDGFRLDTAHNLDGAFLQTLQIAANVPRETYIVGEVDDGDVDVACPYQFGFLDGILNYPAFFQAQPAFTNTGSSIGDFANCINLIKDSGGCSNTALLGSFTENHDQPRIACLNPDIALAKNLLVQTILSDGIPIVYEGQEQHYAAIGGNGNCNDPYNREAIWLSGYDASAPLYGLVGVLNYLRKTAIANDAGWFTYQQYPIYTTGNTIALRKGSDGVQIITVLTNAGSGQSADAFTLSGTGYAAGLALTEVLTCTTLSTDSDGNIDVPAAGGAPFVYYPTSSLEASTLCS